jgi:hypothetical protein
MTHFEPRAMTARVCRRSLNRTKDARRRRRLTAAAATADVAKNIGWRCRERCARSGTRAQYTSVRWTVGSTVPPADWHSPSGTLSVLHVCRRSNEELFVIDRPGRWWEGRLTCGDEVFRRR